jgi:hypothetical protein
VELVAIADILNSCMQDTSAEVTLERLGDPKGPFEHVWKVILESPGIRHATDEMLDSYIMPCIWQYRVCLKTPEDLRCIQSPKDLRGFVHITSEEQARTYLHAFSRIFGIRLFSDFHFLEVSDINQGMITTAEARRTRLNEITGVSVSGKVERVGKDFISTRYLLEYERRRPTRLHAVVERLTPDGHYEFFSLSAVPYEEVHRLIQIPFVRYR